MHDHHDHRMRKSLSEAFQDVILVQPWFLTDIPPILVYGFATLIEGIFEKKVKNDWLAESRDGHAFLYQRVLHPRWSRAQDCSSYETPVLQHLQFL